MHDEEPLRLVLEITNLPGIENYNLDYITVVATNLNFDNYPKLGYEFGWAIPFDADISHEMYTQLSKDLFNGTIDFTSAVDSAVKATFTRD